MRSRAPLWTLLLLALSAASSFAAATTADPDRALPWLDLVLGAATTLHLSAFGVECEACSGRRFRLPTGFRVFLRWVPHVLVLVAASAIVGLRVGLDGQPAARAWQTWVPPLASALSSGLALWTVPHWHPNFELSWTRDEMLVTVF